MCWSCPIQRHLGRRFGLANLRILFDPFRRTFPPSHSNTYTNVALPLTSHAIYFFFLRGQSISLPALFGILADGERSPPKKKAEKKTEPLKKRQKKAKAQEKEKKFTFDKSWQKEKLIQLLLSYDLDSEKVLGQVDKLERFRVSLNTHASLLSLDFLFFVSIWNPTFFPTLFVTPNNHPGSFLLLVDELI
ncbi:uncharacterized protein BDW43DRAFT_196092 [Aspergillus alliaceus]|uniref:uncharacterized protein n=1 Tax=Petromyces alliaceus TaxID=209559 RepID=UPI0012A4A491|nr:uncharacterized protein BDW43DRAFT_196092 [Aspergillus alliaceus]KAB8229074.1 hypothetical protein BDW43DRAFT_196092 [Aspergillus alliaceus]